MKNDALLTRPTLLLRMRDSRDQAAWEQFVEIYTPLVYGFCRQRGLQDADAEDVCQDVMRTVARGAGQFEYDPARGKFRNWLLTVVRSKMANFFASRQRQPDPAGPTTLQQLAESEPGADEQSEWDARYHRHIFQWACERIRAEFQEATWQAFWKTTVEDRDGKEVADGLNMSVGAVYVAKSRVLARLRQEIEFVEAEDTLGPRRLKA